MTRHPIARLMLGYRPLRGSLPPRPACAYHCPPDESASDALACINRELDCITALFRLSLKAKDFRLMSLDLTALTALGPRIDAVAEKVKALESGSPTAVADAVAQTTAADQEQVAAATTDLADRMSALETAAGISPEPVAPAALAFNPTTLPDAVIATAYSASITTTGGTAPVTIALESGTLPDGLTMDGAGAISGVPSGSATSQTFTVQATDAAGDKVSESASITVNVA